MEWFIIVICAIISWFIIKPKKQKGMAQLWLRLTKDQQRHIIGEYLEASMLDIELADLPKTSLWLSILKDQSKKRQLVDSIQAGMEVAYLVSPLAQTMHAINLIEVFEKLFLGFPPFDEIEYVQQAAKELGMPIEPTRMI